jgi:ADP-ribose pyrophosphatase YjhB (NUDIX family)
VHRKSPVDAEDQVLLVKPSADRAAWGMPKGRREHGEDAVAAARREVLEETGISVEIGNALPITHRNSRLEEKTLFTFMAKPLGTTAPHPADGTNAEVRWFGFDKLPALHAYQVSVIAAGIELVRSRNAASHT